MSELWVVCAVVPGKWWIICGYSRDPVYIHSHILTQRHKVIHKSTKCIPELCGLYLWVCGHVFALACICVFALGRLRSRGMCVYVWNYSVRIGGTQAAERKKHKRHRVKLNLTVSIGVGGKFDCSLQVVWGFWYFKLPLSVSARQNQVYKSALMLSEEKKREGTTATELELGSTFPDPTASTSVPAPSLVTGCQHCSNGKTGLLPSDINTWI